MLGLPPKFHYTGQPDMENSVPCIFHLSCQVSLQPNPHTSPALGQEVLWLLSSIDLDFPGCAYSRYRSKRHQLPGTPATICRWGQFLPTASKCKAMKEWSRAPLVGQSQLPVVQTLCLTLLWSWQIPWYPFPWNVQEQPCYPKVTFCTNPTLNWPKGGRRKLTLLAHCV